jgi:hypothetical protein
MFTAFRRDHKGISSDPQVEAGTQGYDASFFHLEPELDKRQRFGAPSRFTCRPEYPSARPAEAAQSVIEPTRPDAPDVPIGRERNTPE